jgi:hypothetical protein
MVSPNQDPYELPTPKHWRIIHHIHSLKYELLHELLYYIRVHRSWSVQSLNIAKAIQKTTLDDTRAALNPKMRSPRQLFRARSPNWLPSPPVGCHWATWTCHSNCCTQAFLQQKRSTNKAWATKAQQNWPINVVINNQLLVCKASWQSSILNPNPHYEWDLTFKF